MEEQEYHIIMALAHPGFIRPQAEVVPVAVQELLLLRIMP